MVNFTCRFCTIYKVLTLLLFFSPSPLFSLLYIFLSFSLEKIHDLDNNCIGCSLPHIWPGNEFPNNIILTKPMGLFYWNGHVPTHRSFNDSFIIWSTIGKSNWPKQWEKSGNQAKFLYNKLELKIYIFIHQHQALIIKYYCV